MNTHSRVVSLTTLVLALATIAARSTSAALVATVPGTADPWLAGMPDGTRASGSDFAPTNSPVLVPGLLLRSSERLTFEVSGGVANGPGIPLDPPDGVDADGRGWWPQHNAGVEHGIGNIFRGPGNALMGVFLTDQRPDLTAAPPTLDFRPEGNVPGGMNYLTFAPELKQVFFIGDGLTNGGIRQQIVVPEGASRLFLGAMDSTGWYNNWGEFHVAVAVVPEPSTLSLGALGLICLVGLRRRRLLIPLPKTAR